MVYPVKPIACDLLHHCDRYDHIAVESVRRGRERIRPTLGYVLVRLVASLVNRTPSSVQLCDVLGSIVSSVCTRWVGTTFASSSVDMDRAVVCLRRAAVFYAGLGLALGSGLLAPCPATLFASSDR